MVRETSDKPAIVINNITKTFAKRKALSNVSLSVTPGEMVALIGPSGSGKSTLLRHISGLINCDNNQSQILVHGKTVQKNGKISPQITKVRSEIGFIFQQFNLVGRLSLIKNVLTGLLAHIPTWRTMIQLFTYNEKLAAIESLDRVGLAEYAAQRSSTLSGGQQQRASIARAMLQNARIILADEPIASLDPESARLVMDGLYDLNKRDGVTVMVSLHQVQFALQYCRRSIALKDGIIVYDGPSKDLTSDTLRSIYGTNYSEFVIDSRASNAIKRTYENSDVYFDPKTAPLIEEKVNI